MCGCGCIRLVVLLGWIECYDRWWLSVLGIIVSLISEISLQLIMQKVGVLVLLVRWISLVEKNCVKLLKMVMVMQYVIDSFVVCSCCGSILFISIIEVGEVIDIGIDRQLIMISNWVSDGFVLMSVKVGQIIVSSVICDYSMILWCLMWLVSCFVNGDSIICISVVMYVVQMFSDSGMCSMFMVQLLRQQMMMYVDEVMLIISRMLVRSVW